MRTVKISRRAFLTGLGLASTAALLSACNTVPASSHSGAAPSQPDSEAPASSAASEVPAQPILSVDEFPITDGSTACIPLIAQIMADTTGLDLETARSAVTTNTTAQAWRNLGLYGNNYGDSVKLIIAYEAPESVKEELKADGDPLEQKAIGRDALVFIVNEDNPVQSLTLQQLKDIYAGTITNWKDVGGNDAPIVVVGREAGSGTRGAFEELLKLEDACKYSNELDSTGAVMAKVASTPGSIGYVSLDVLDDTVKALKLDGAEPTEENIKAGKYFLSRPFVMATKGEISEQSDLVKALFDFIYSDEGSELVKSVGLITADK